jgi:hypothetical protein
VVLTGIAGLLAGAGLATLFRPKVVKVHRQLVAAQQDVERGRCRSADRRFRELDATMLTLEAKRDGQANTMGVLLSAYEGARRDYDRKCGRGLRGFVSKRGPKDFCVHNEPTGRIIVAKGRERCYGSRAEAHRVWYGLDCKYTDRHCEKVKT